jgi:chromosome segregation ATPase
MEPAFPPDDQEARVVDLRPRAAARRLLDAESELDALRAHLDRVVAERDAARSAVRESQADALAVREELAGRLAAETAAMSAVAVLRGQVEELRVRADARDARDHALAKLAGELAVTARTAREEVERHAAARVAAEAAVQVERKRVAEVEAALAAERERAAHAEGALRSELESLRTARDRCRQRRVRSPLGPPRGARSAHRSGRSPAPGRGRRRPRRPHPRPSGARPTACATARWSPSRSAALGPAAPAARLRGR